MAQYFFLIFAFMLGVSATDNGCCTVKTVGEVEYHLISAEGTTTGFNCINTCVYEQFGRSGSRFCFATGKHPVVCLTQTTAWAPASTGCGSSWTQHGPYCYKFFEEKLSWYDAQSRCEQEKGHLLSIHSQDLFDYFHSSPESTHGPEEGTVWSGGNDIDTEGVWVWTDGTAWNHQNWRSGEPNNEGGNQHCAEINPDGTWNDHDCNDQRAFICHSKV